MFKPQLALTRLQIKRANAFVYDEKFGLGLNIVRGRNGSGKSTIVDFIFYLLGGCLSSWKEEAASCEYVSGEVLLNGIPVVLKRYIQPDGKAPMEIFWGTLDKSSKAAATEWEKYPFRRSQSLESYSQVLFKAMGMPEVKGDAENNITMHQLLRLMYSDQSTPSYRLFRHERFDSALVKETVGDLLCGIYDGELYDKALALREKEAEFDQLSRQFVAIMQVLGTADQDTNLELLDSEVKNWEVGRNELYQELKSYQEEPSGVKQSEIDSKNRRLHKELGDLNQEILRNQESIERIRLDIEDSREFIEHLQRRIQSLEESLALRKEIEGVEFRYCPVCFTSLADHPDTKSCYLCKSPIQEMDRLSGLLRHKQELDTQLRESKLLISRRVKEVELLEARQPQLVADREKRRLAYEQLSTTTLSRADQKLTQLFEQIGYANRTLEALLERRRLYVLINQIKEPRDRLRSEIAELHDWIGAAEKRQLKRREQTLADLSEKAVFLLKKDINLEEAFETADAVQFDFRADLVTVDHRLYFSESSHVYLKNAAHLSLLWASCVNEYLRFPRFLILDGVENGGMTADRSQNFQHLVHQISDQLQVDHQIIMTTSMIAPDLEKSAYVVGDFYTKEHKSLRIG